MAKKEGGISKGVGFECVRCIFLMGGGDRWEEMIGGTLRSGHGCVGDRLVVRIIMLRG